MGELLLIMVVALLFVGPDKLPQAAKAIGKGIRDFRKHTLDLQDTIESDEKLGEAMRELRSALSGTYVAPPRPVPRPGLPPAGPGAVPAATAAPSADGVPTVTPASGSIAKGELPAAEPPPASAAAPARSDDDPRHG
jgi:sec-independent protein translocase protein TatB